MLAPPIMFGTQNYKTAVSFFDTVFCNKITLHGGAWKASATHQSHMCAEIDSIAENRLAAIHLNIFLSKIVVHDIDSTS